MATPSRAESQASVHAGLSLLHAGRIADAEAIYRRVLAADPDHAAALHHLGLIAAQQERPQEAAALLRRAVSLNPADALGLANLGEILRRLGQFAQASDVFQAALKLDPHNVITHVNYGMTLLAMGDYTRGWAEYEWRVRGSDAAGAMPLPTFGKPRWTPDGAFAGKTALLFTDQGFGDGIQFVRYASLVSARGSAVLLRCPPPLADLFRTVWGVERVLSIEEPLPSFDAQCPLHSLPFVFGTTADTIPAHVPYLDPDPAAAKRWAMMLPPAAGKLRVGLVWAGSPQNLHDRSRSLEPAELAPLSAVASVGWVLLQKRVPGSRFAGSPPFPAVDVGDELTDFSDTAAVLANLDLLIAVDTSTAHLAGALGKPVWMLLAAVPDWRWLSDTPRTPWYPTARLFRQPTPGQWGPVLQEVAAALTAAVTDRRLLTARV